MVSVPVRVRPALSVALAASGAALIGMSMGCYQAYLALAAAMRQEAMDFYYTSQYLLHHNGRKIISDARAAAQGTP